jgi:hypothetical protein
MDSEKYIQRSSSWGEKEFWEFYFPVPGKEYHFAKT